MYRARRIVASLPSGVDRSVPVRRALRLFDRFRHSAVGSRWRSSAAGSAAASAAVLPSAAASAPRPPSSGSPRAPTLPCWTAYVGTVPTVPSESPGAVRTPEHVRLTSVLSRNRRVDRTSTGSETPRGETAASRRADPGARSRTRNGLLARGEIRRHVRVAQMSSSRFLDVVAVKDDDAIGRAKQPPRRPLRDGMRRVRAAQRETHHALGLFFVPEFLARSDLVFGRRRQRGPVHATRGGGEHAAGHGTEHDAFEKLLAATPDAHEVGSRDEHRLRHTDGRRLERTRAYLGDSFLRVVSIERFVRQERRRV